MEAATVGSVLFLLVYPGLPVAWMLAPRLRKLRAAGRGRPRALEDLLLPLLVLFAPCLFLIGMQLWGMAPRRDAGWLLAGLFLGLPLWAVAAVLLQLAPALLARLRRLQPRQRSAPSQAGGPLEGISGYLLPLTTAVLALMLTALALEISLYPCIG
jgi:hypothetical protein